MSFWEQLPRPFFVLAPLADVTDAAFRRIIAKYSKYGGRDMGDGSEENLPARAFRVGGPQVMYTEFVSADGLARAPEKGRRKLLRDLMFTESERPIVAQFFTSIPAHMEQAAALARELQFDGVDINMGCPEESVNHQCAGAALIKDPKLAQEVIYAAKKGAQKLPVSVKTRLGFHVDQLEEWLLVLLETEPAAITIHARTRKEMSKVPARWERVKRAVEIRNEQRKRTLIVGNGDVADLADARAKAQETGCDGVMLGRAIFGNPWLFSSEAKKENNDLFLLSERRKYGDPQPMFSEKMPSVEEKLHVMVEHAKLFEELLGDIKNFAIMKKHFKAYIEGFPGAKELRMELMEAANAKEVQVTIEKWLQ